MEYTNKEVKKILKDFVQNLKLDECMYREDWTNTHVEFYYGQGGPKIQKRTGAQIGNLYKGSVILEAPRLSKRALNNEISEAVDDNAFPFWIRENDLKYENDDEKYELFEKYTKTEKYKRDWEIVYDEAISFYFDEWKQKVIEKIDAYFENEDLNDEIELTDDFFNYFSHLSSIYIIK